MSARGPSSVVMFNVAGVTSPRVAAHAASIVQSAMTKAASPLEAVEALVIALAAVGITYTENDASETRDVTIEALRSAWDALASTRQVHACDEVAS